jgi:hypothetical protein
VADLTVAVIMAVLVLAVARIAYGVPLPRQSGGFVLAALLAGWAVAFGLAAARFFRWE